MCALDVFSTKALCAYMTAWLLADMAMLGLFTFCPVINYSMSLQEQTSGETMTTILLNRKADMKE
jgi:hypothetical protein